MSQKNCFYKKQKAFISKHHVFCVEQAAKIAGYRTGAKQAFSKVRYNISPLAFEDIYNLLADLFRFTNHPKTWNGYCIFAVDGSELAVAHSKNNETEFGLKGGNRHFYPSARPTALYDVANDLIVDAVFTGISVGEREHAHRLLLSKALVNGKGF